MPPKKLQKIASRRSSDVCQPSTALSGRHIVIVTFGLILAGSTLQTSQRLVSVKSMLLMDDLTYDLTTSAAMAREEKEIATLESWAATDAIGKFHKRQNVSNANNPSQNLLLSPSTEIHQEQELPSNSTRSNASIRGENDKINDKRGLNNATMLPYNHSQIHDSHNDNATNLNASFDYQKYYYNTSYNEPLWSTNNTMSTEKLPLWLTEYMEWHHQQRLLLNESNWQHHNSFRFLVPVARKGFKSGGMTDRIRPLPAYVRLAAQTKRLLLIHWDRPFALEEFLLPPMGGLDWRVPEFMVELVRSEIPRGSHFAPIEKASRAPRNKIVTATYQSWNYGDVWYKEQMQEGETPLEAIFRDLWRMLFTPSPPVAKRIHHNFDRMGLAPGEFATAHIRALYAIEDRPRDETIQLAHNAMNCASILRPGGPFFVASDSTLAIQSAIAYGSEHNVTVVAVQHPRQPLHVGLQNEEDPSLTPEHFYDGFVDLYLMASTRCAAVGPGGFARWGNWLGFNETCAINHSGRKFMNCTWMDVAALEASGHPMPGYPSEEDRKERQRRTSREIPRFPVPISVA